MLFNVHRPKNTEEYRQVRLPERLKSLALGREKTELLHLPASLESLTLGENYNQLFEVGFGPFGPVFGGQEK